MNRVIQSVGLGGYLKIGDDYLRMSTLLKSYHKKGLGLVNDTLFLMFLRCLYYLNSENTRPNYSLLTLTDWRLHFICVTTGNFVMFEQTYSVAKYSSPPHSIPRLPTETRGKNGRLTAI